MLIASNHQYADCPQLMRDFLFYLKTIKGRSPRTVEAYYIDLRLFFRYLKREKLGGDANAELSELSIHDLSSEFLCSVTMSDVYAFLNYVQTSQSNGAATRSRKVSAIRSFYKYLTTKTTYLEDNPVEGLEVPSIRKTVPKYLTLEESIRLLQASEGSGMQREYCMITLLLNCGMRLSELVGIQLQDIRDNSLKLLGKGNKERVVFLNEACISAIESYLNVRKPPVKQEFRNVLFLSSRGTKLTPRRVEQLIEEALKRADLSGKGYSPHKLRHTAATLMYQHGGVDVRVLKEILGHANLGTTEIYTHVSDQQMQRAADLSPLAKVKKSKQGKGSSSAEE